MNASAAQGLQPDSSYHAEILLVENQVDSNRALSDLLANQGYRIRKVIDGQMALMAISAEQPDLILLSVNLPALNGYEVCQKLKQSPETKDIPVIFFESQDKAADRVRAFAVGGVDYIAKPFQLEEILARINHQLTLYRQQQQLKQQNAWLQQQVEERQQVEDILRQTESRYLSIFENATEGIFRSTLAGGYLSANPALVRIYGYDSVQELVDTITDIGSQLYVQPKRREELLVFLKQYGFISEAESLVYRKDGSQIWISENIWVVRDQDGAPLCYEGTVQDITERHRMEEEIRQQRQQSERLLLNILPYQIARRLKAQRQTIAESFDEVTVLFADLVDFTAVSAQVSPRELVALLNEIFSTFDQLAERYGLEKIKTIGDAYMVAAGLPTPDTDHAEAIAYMALEMQETIVRFKKPDGDPFQLRIGINTGSVVAGVIGLRKFTYDLWGDTVNIASRMESTGEPGRIQVTAHTYEQLKHEFVLQERGKIPVKGMGEMMTYWLIGPKEEED